VEWLKVKALNSKPSTAKKKKKGKKDVHWDCSQIHFQVPSPVGLSVELLITWVSSPERRKKEEGEREGRGRKGKGRGRRGGKEEARREVCVSQGWEVLRSFASCLGHWQGSFYAYSLALIFHHCKAPPEVRTTERRLRQVGPGFGRVSRCVYTPVCVCVCVCVCVYLKLKL
jgi:hypothetical protein